MAAMVGIAALLFALLLLIAAAMVWQEARATPEATPVYVVEEAVPYVFRRLSDDAMSRLDVDDVRRILEWEVYYLQGLDKPRAGRNGDLAGRVSGGHDAIMFVEGRCSGEGYEYLYEDIAEVLAHQGEYLAAIGAVGPEADNPW